MKVAALTSEHRLRGPVGRRHLPALMAGLAGVPALMAGLAGVRGSTDTSCPHLYCRRWASWPQLLARIPRFRPALDLDVGAGTVLGPLSGLRHAAGVQLLHHQGMGLVRQRLTDVVGVIAADPFLLAPQFLQLPPPPPRPHRAPLLALIPRGPGCQAGHFRQRVCPARTVGDLPHIPVQTQHSRGRAARH